MSDDEYQYEPPSGERWGGKTWTLIAALGVVLVIAVAGIWLWQTDDDSSSPGPTAAPTSTAVPPSTIGGATTTAAPEGSPPPSVPSGPPDGFVGGRDFVDGVPVGFSRDQQGAVSAAATWVSYLFVCPLDQRPEGVRGLLAEGAPALDPCDSISADLAPLKGMSALAVRGQVEGDAGTVEVLSARSADFDAERWDITFEIVTVSLVWNGEASDWRITTWSRRNLFGDIAPTPETFSGFQWVRPLGFVRTTSPFALGYGSPPAAPGAAVADTYVGGGQIEGGVPMFFVHDENGAVSAAASWVSYMMVCPQPERAEGVTVIMTPSAPSLDPCNPVVQDDNRMQGMTAFAVRGTAAGDSVTLEVLAGSSADFTSGWEAGMKVVTVSLVWDVSAGDWRVTTWSRRDLFDDSAPAITPDLFAGFEWVRPIGFALTPTRFVEETEG